MSSLDVRLERLVIRLRGVTPEVARSATHNLGEEILQHLAQQGQRPAGRGTVAVDTLHLGTVTAPESATPPQLRVTVARTIANALAARLPAGHGG